ncbi:hypothetical protein THAOC_32947, partial [Thalassiosira oceanica]
ADLVEALERRAARHGNARRPGHVHAGARRPARQSYLATTSKSTWGTSPPTMSQDAISGSSDVQPPAQAVPAAGPLPDAVTEEELMGSGHELHERYTCPLCCLPMALPLPKHSFLKTCCMKTLCRGCLLASCQHGMLETCPFCRTPTQFSDAAALPLVQKRVDAKDPKATEYLAQAYYNGRYGLEKDVPRAIELWTEAARLGDLDAHYCLGYWYCRGEGVEEDVARGIRNWQQAAIQGHPESRHALGIHEDNNGNHGLAVQHWMISAKMGLELSLNEIKLMFMKGHATKAQHAEALRGYQTALEEARSPQREEVKAFFNGTPTAACPYPASRPPRRRLGRSRSLHLLSREAASPTAHPPLSIARTSRDASPPAVDGDRPEQREAGNALVDPSPTGRSAGERTHDPEEGCTIAGPGEWATLRRHVVVLEEVRRPSWRGAPSRVAHSAWRARRFITDTSHLMSDPSGDSLLRAAYAAELRLNQPPRSMSKADARVISAARFWIASTCCSHASSPAAANPSLFALDAPPSLLRLDHQEEAMCRGKEEQGAPTTLHSPGASTGGPLQPVTEEELMSSGHELLEGYTCPLCCLPIALPVGMHSTFMPCCMKTVCHGCVLASYQQGLVESCAFCRTPIAHGDAAILAQVRKRVEAKDPQAIEFLARTYYNGGHSLQQETSRAIELWTEAANLGDLDAHFNLGYRYWSGKGVEQDVARGIRHLQHAAIQGHPGSRFLLGFHEYKSRNDELAVQHWMISAKMGDEDSLNNIKAMFMEGHASKAQYAETLKGYQKALEETKSPQREEAKAVFNESD